MKLSLHIYNKVAMRLLTAALLLVSLSANADIPTITATPSKMHIDGTPLITDVSQLSSPWSEASSVGNLSRLIDYNYETNWATDWSTSRQNTPGHYLDIDLGHQFDNKKLIVRIARKVVSSSEWAEPRKFKVLVSEESNPEDADWKEYCNVVLPINNSETNRYLSFEVISSKVRSIRLICAENGATAAGKTKYYFMLGDLQVYNLPLEEIKVAKFVHTQGIIDTHNHNKPGLDDYCDWNLWVDGKWTGDKDVLDKLGIEMPDLSYIQGVDEYRGNLPIDGVRQRSSVVIHELYAVPGQSLNLEPFSDIRVGHFYHEQMTRWYDYVTDKTCPYLRCPTGNDNHYDIDGAGSFAGVSLDMNHTHGATMVFQCPDGGLQKDMWIAADLYFDVSFDDGRNLEGGNFYEPMVSFRHLFHIIDAEKAAKAISADAAANIEYIKSRRRKITARAGADFKIRLEIPTKQYDHKSAAFTAQVYMKNGKPTYVENTHILVYEADGVTPCTALQGKFDKRAHYTIPGNSAVGTSDQYLSRALVLEGKYAKAGTYIVRLVGQNENGNYIMLDGNRNLVLEEWEIEFVNSNAASLINEKDLPSTHKHSDDYLRNMYGSPIAQINFDSYAKLFSLTKYQNYLTSSVLACDSKIYDDVALCASDGPLSVPDSETDLMRFKWPMPWRDSNYAFVFDKTHEYNTYTIVNDFSLTRYHDGALYELSSDPNAYYDRLGRETNGNHRGFFYYVNAAADPGEICKLPISELCSGSTLYVSGWLCEQSGGGHIGASTEIADLIVTFQVTTPEGETKKLHSFVTGTQPVGTAGQWYHFYYTFVINFEELGIKNDSRNTYSVVLENNATSSGGADYAIDDIQVFVTKPQLFARQVLPACNNESSARIQTDIPFDVLLATMGEVESTTPGLASNRKKFYYTFLKKDVFDSSYDGTNYAEAFNKALLRYKYNLNNSDEEQRFGTVRFSTCYNENLTYDEVNAEGSVSTRAGRYTDDDGRDCLVFNTNPNDEELVVGGEYYMAIVTADENDTSIDNLNSVDIANLFSIYDKCAKVCEFRVHSSSVIKKDGIVVGDVDNIKVCADQRPVISIDVLGIVDNGKDSYTEILQHNAAFDWFDGPMSTRVNEAGETEIGYADFVNENNGLRLYEVMQQFRNYNRDVTSLDDENLVTNPDFTPEMLDWLRELNTKNPETGRTKLLINNVSYIFPPIKMAAGVDSINVYVTAIPINRYDDTKYKICSDPTEVRVTVINHSPNMRHGFPLAVTDHVFEYPEWMEDVPLRVSLRQLREASGNLATVAADTPHRLTLPIRRVEPVSEGATSMMPAADDNLYLADTDDYDKLLDNGADEDDEGLKVVGRIVSLKAVKNPDMAHLIKDNELAVIFDENFDFREGHYYRMQFAYKENVEEYEFDTETHVQGKKYCDGQHVFTIKIVPEYQKWTGAVSRNWANDANWTRISAAELNVNPADIDQNHPLYPYVTEGKHKCTQTYAPLDFTKVIISDTHGAGDERVPVLPPYPYDIATQHSPAQLIYNGKRYYFIETPDAIDDNSGVTLAEHPEIAERGEATRGIQYEMASETLATRAGIFCRPWYTHTVDEIHFTDRAVIPNQHNLTYNRAWVDMELTSGEWHAVSSPLQETVAGNMYLPTASARQETQLFVPIAYDPVIHNRFAPAVYQRAWNKQGTAKVVRLNDSATDAAVKSTWSYVYNDVTEDYSRGKAFAVKADVSNVAGNPARVLFRLPKADARYDYYKSDDSLHPGADFAEVPVTDKHYQLNPVNFTATVGAGESSDHFMIGNPFMGLLDMSAFFDANTNLARKFWVVEPAGESVVTWDEAGDIITTVVEDDDADPFDFTRLYLQRGYLPPKTAVFVEALEPTASLTVRYAASMIAQDAPLQAVEPFTRSAGGSAPSLRITALRGGHADSRALVRVDPDAAAGYDAGEDVALLVDDMQSHLSLVYTVAGDVAASINRLPAVTTVGLGVVAESDDSATELLIEGVDPMHPMSLLDAATGERTPLAEGMTVAVTGSTAGRYFIVADDADDDDAATIAIAQRGREVAVTAYGEGHMEVSVFDLPGRCVLRSSTAAEEASFSLNPGVYIINVVKDSRRLTRKIVVL